MGCSLCGLYWRKHRADFSKTATSRLATLNAELSNITRSKKGGLGLVVNDLAFFARTCFYEAVEDGLWDFSARLPSSSSLESILSMRAIKERIKVSFRSATTSICIRSWLDLDPVSKVPF